MGRIFSGVQPTGHLHLGNYLGAIRHWADMQHQHESLFCIVDLHAITVPQDPKELHQNVRNTVATYIACGIDPEHSTIYAQSAVPEHAELAWILSCHTPLGWLNRMTQFKEKAGKHKEKACLGLYGYPVLMAADILLFHATHVPVGEDQKQHLELTRDIAGAFNRFVEKDYFTLPDPYIFEGTGRVMSLRDGTKKMSKSDPSDFSRINLTDDKDTIVAKVKKAKSDAIEGITLDEERPEATNLLNIYASFAGIPAKDAALQFQNEGFATFKQALADILVEKLAPITQQVLEIQSDHDYIDNLLKQGADRARALAEKHIREIKDMVGF